ATTRTPRTCRKRAETVIAASDRDRPTDAGFVRLAARDEVARQRGSRGKSGEVGGSHPTPRPPPTARAVHEIDDTTPWELESVSISTDELARLTTRRTPDDWAELDTRAVDTIRVLAADAVQNVGSGHPGTAMSLAPLAY